MGGTFHREYWNKEARTFRQVKSLKEKIESLNCPPPSNIDGVPPLDATMKAHLIAQNQTKKITEDDEAAKTHQRALQVMGPLGKAWQTVSSHYSAQKAGKPPPGDLDLKWLNEALALAVTITASTCQQIAHNRRLNVLRASFTHHEAEKIIKDGREVFESANQSELFGKEFSDFLKDADKDAKTLSSLLVKKKPAQPTPKPAANPSASKQRGRGNPRRGNQPFLRGSHSNRGARGSGNSNYNRERSDRYDR